MFTVAKPDCGCRTVNVAAVSAAHPGVAAGVPLVGIIRTLSPTQTARLTPLVETEMDPDNMSLINGKKSAQLTADEALRNAIERIEHVGGAHPGSSVSGDAWALVSIALSLRELAAKR